MHRNTIEAEILDAHHQKNTEEDLGWESLTNKTPADHVMAAEEANDELPRAAVDRVRAETMNKLLDEFLSSWLTGKHDPVLVGKNVLAMAKFIDHRAVADWTLEEIATACGETKARVSKRIMETCNEPIERSGGLGRAAWQQDDGKRETTRKALKGNRCHKGGKKISEGAARIGAWAAKREKS